MSTILTTDHLRRAADLFAAILPDQGQTLRTLAGNIEREALEAIASAQPDEDHSAREVADSPVERTQWMKDLTAPIAEPTDDEPADDAPDEDEPTGD